MTMRTEYAHGEFSWVDLATTDAAAAKRFYGGLLGWQFTDMSPSPDMTYTDCRVKDASVAGLYTMSKDMLSKGLSPRWLPYINVRSADEIAKRAAHNGGKVLQGPFDVFDVGRTATMQDPTGAHVAVWEAKKHIGAGLINEPGGFCWNELTTPDVDAAGKFYRATFDWSADSMDMGPAGTYTIFKAGTTQIGGMMARPPEMKNVPPYWLTYFAVADCDAAAATTAKLGGTVLRPPDDIPNVGRFAVCRDGQGAAFAVIKLEMP